MTGAGVARGETELGDLAVELRSVNGKNLSVKMRLPSAAHGFDAEFERRLRHELRRGHLRVAMEIVEPAAANVSVVDAERAKQAAEELRALAGELGLASDLSISDVLSIPGVLRSQHTPTRVSQDTPEQVSALFDAALRGLIEHRRREGEATAELIGEQLDSLDAARGQAAARAPRIVAEHRERLLGRVNEFLEGQARTMTDDDVLREVAMFADRADVEEELQRISAHLGEARSLLAAGGEIGRKLEFLLQETLREINTLGSKSPDVEMAHTVVNMKANIDRAREQAANLE